MSQGVDLDGPAQGESRRLRILSVRVSRESGVSVVSEFERGGGGGAVPRLCVWPNLRRYSFPAKFLESPTTDMAGPKHRFHHPM